MITIKKNDPAIGATLELLAETYPKCFFVYEARRRPLKIGIHADLVATLDGAVTEVELGKALRAYATNKTYRSRLVAGAIRIGLDGEPAGLVAPEHAVAAPPRPRPRPPQPVSKQPAKRLSLSDLRAAGKQRRAQAAT